MKRNLGRQETQFFAYTQMRELRTVRRGDLVSSLLRMSPIQERKLLSRLSRGGLIARVRPGLYLVPPRLPLGGAWTPNEALAINTLMTDADGRYQICGPNTFSRYGWDDQIPNRVYAYNNRLSGNRTVGAIELTLIKVADKRLGDTDAVSMADGEAMVYASRVRALVDAVYDWARFNSLPRGYDWIRAELRTKRTSAIDLVKATLRYGDVGTIRRMGFLLERERVDPTLLRKLDRVQEQTTSLIPCIPVLPKMGIPDRRWGVVLYERS
jgi:predicted transcriptional regulator of viral defense system